MQSLSKCAYTELRLLFLGTISDTLPLPQITEEEDSEYTTFQFVKTRKEATGIIPEFS
jgi:hypothetical protein